MVLGGDLLKSLGLKQKKTKHNIKGSDRLFEGSTSPMIGFITYKFIYLNPVKVAPKYYFMNAYVEVVLELEHVRNST